MYIKKTLLIIIGVSIFISVFTPQVLAQYDQPALNLPPTNAFDKIHSDNGTITAQNFSMPLTIKGGSGIQVKSNNATHTLQISSNISQASGTYNTTQANNVNINTGGYKINFINGTGATVHLQNSGSGNQVNVTVSATGTSSGVSSLNALTGALTIACVSGNTTCTTSGGNTITVNTAWNVVMTNGATQNITKQIILSNSGVALTVQAKTGNTEFDVNSPSGSSNVDFRLTTQGTDTWRIFADRVNRDLTFGIFGNPSILLDTSGNTLLTHKITKYNNITTAGWGVPAIYGSGRLTGLTAASGTVTSYTVGASDGTFEVSGDILATTSVNYSFDERVTWTDETGTARLMLFQFSGTNISGLTTVVTNTNGPSFYGIPYTIRAQHGTTITIASSAGGTYTNVTYNIEGFIKQIS